jgi:hypothetical protein
LQIGAQGVSVSPEDAAKKQEIKEIKLGEEHVYADVYEVAADDEAALRLAKTKSVNMLQARVIEQAAGQLGMDKEAVKKIFDVIDDKCQNIVITNGDMVRVFTYIMKDKVGLTRKKVSVDDDKYYFGEDSIAKNLADQVLEGQDSINYVVSQPEVKEESVEKVKEETVVETPEKKEEAKKDEGTPLVKILPAEQVIPAPEVVIPELCQKLIATKNFDGLMAFLRKEKAANKLMWGNANRMQRHELCYIVALDRVTKEIVAVLDKGEAERMNFMNKKMEHARNYRGTHS